MKIAPLAQGGIPTPAPQAEEGRSHGIRSIQMRVNQTPGRVTPGEMEAGAVPVAGDGAALSISPTSETSARVADEETQPLSPQLAAIARQRRALQQERQAFEREKAALAKPQAQGDVVPVDRLKTEPLSVLLENGVTYDQLTEAILANQNGYSPAEIQALKAEIKALKEGVDKTFSDKEQQQRKEALASMQREASQLSRDDAFELVRETGSIPDVMRMIEKTYDETGEVLDVREAMELIEAELEKDALRVAQAKKLQAKLAPPASTPQPQQRTMRTLTNRDTASVPLSPRARALAAFNGTLRR